ncbi:hypothetical protein GWI33_021975 [Rhynchophorus ferrugineus]|uniref:Transposase n=1 Tax=Rhynchophorus ferrugineus TaxID=354439 RepID=A0A834HN97_RHYFE|nr:hypothetical protein GWI33_021975 [Rhynchophorus ferrugineus]
MDQKQFWVLILHYFLMGINTIQAKQWLETFYKDSTLSETTIKLKLHELTNIVRTSKERVGFIMYEYLTMIRLCSKWVQRWPIVDQKQERVDDSEQYLVMFKHNKPEFLRRYMTMDETWIHHFTPESKRSSSK